MPSIFRRRLVTSALASLVLAPFLSLQQREAHAASGKAKRLLIFYTMGTHPDMWRPTNVQGESSFDFSDMTSPLAAVREHLVLVDGLVSGVPGDNHGSPAGLTGLSWSSKGKSDLISVDQYVGDQLAAAGMKRPLSTLLLGARTFEGGGISAFHRTNNLPTISSPLAAFTTVFGNQASPEQMANLLKRRKSVLDLIRGEVTSLEQRVGASEKVKLEAHLDSLRQVETRLGQTMMACQKPTQPSDDTGNVQNANKAHIDVLISAFACDTTRVGAIQFGSDGNMPVDIPGLNGEEHGMLHNSKFGELVTLEKWLSERFVDIIDKLKAIPEADGSGSLFDNTLIAWCRDMGDAVNHNQRDMKYVLAGGAGGYLKTNPNGRYLHGQNRDPQDRHERLLLALIDGMGFTDFSGFGDQNLAEKSPLPGVTA